MLPRSTNDKKAAARAKIAGFVRSGAWTFLSLVLSTILGFAFLAELRSGPIIAGLAGLGAYFVLAYGVPTRTRGWAQTEMPNIDGPETSDDPRVELLVDAHQHIATLSATKNEVPLPVAETLVQLHAHATSILEGVTASPEKLSPVLRFFTYYLPSTADLAMDRVKLATHAGPERLEEIDHTLARLVDAFKGFKEAVLSPDLESVDLDIELLDEAINADFESLKR